MPIRHMKKPGLIVAAVWFFLPFELGGAYAQTTKEKPNILFILTDDQSPHDLKAYDPDSDLETPFLDQLASEGMVFDGAYHMGSFVSAVCSPSRHMMKMKIKMSVLIAVVSSLLAGGDDSPI